MHYGQADISYSEKYAQGGVTGTKSDRQWLINVLPIPSKQKKNLMYKKCGK